MWFKQATLTVFATAVVALVARPAVGQASDHGGLSTPREHGSLRIFLDCASSVACDTDYLRTALPYITYVRDPAVADVHVLLTAEATGSGGQITTGRFMGRASLAGLVDTLHVATNRGATDDEQRRAIAQLVSIGLVRFIARTGLATDLSVVYASPRKNGQPARQRDPWNAWVYGAGATVQLSGQQYNQAGIVSGILTADHVTKAWKFDIAANYNYSYSAIHQDSVNATTIQRSILATGQMAKSVTDHWSAGLVTSGSSSPFSNERLVAHLAPAIEYDVFPYDEATHHQLILLYAIGGTRFNYVDRTIFGHLNETRADQALSVAIGITEPWGSASVAIQAAAFLDNVRQNRQVLGGDFRIRLFSGFSLTVEPSFSSIHDQIYLQAGSASRDDILLARRQLATNFQYQMSVGLTFTFGSIFNGIVNPRFGRAIMAGASQ